MQSESRKGSLHDSAYVPRKPRQFSKYRSNGADPGIGPIAIPPGSMHPTRKDTTLAVRLRDNGICQFCGARGDTPITIKHIKKGGTWDIPNVALSCAPCELAGRRKSCETLAMKRLTIRTFRGLDPDD